VLLNNGGGTFAPELHTPAGPFVVPVPMPAGGKPDSVVVADADGDGWVDVITCSYELQASVEVFLNPSGNGMLSAPNLYGRIGSEALKIGAGDLNGDGHADLVVLSAMQPGVDNSLQVFDSYSSGFPTSPTASFPVPQQFVGILDVRDMNSDGRLDAIVAGPTVLLGDGAGGLGAYQVYGLPPIGGGICSGDFNGDGKADVVLTDTFGHGGFFYGDGAGGFRHQFQAIASAPCASPHTTSATADFNGDGIPDLVKIESHWVSLYVGLPGGGYQAPQRYNPGWMTMVYPNSQAEPDGLVIADFNGDGKPDVAVDDQMSGELIVFLNGS
jgi:hypothetical protein